MKCNNSFGFVCWLFIICLACFPFYVSAQSKATDTLTVYFSFNDYSVSNSQSGRLGSFLDKYTFAADSIITIKIIGYTDTVGTEKYNTVLSLKRCRVVSDAVLRKMPVKIQLLPRGEQDAGRQTDSLDRRVVIIRYYKSHTAASDAGTLQNEQTAIKEKENNKKKDKVIDTVIVLDNIYFEPDHPILTPGSMDALPHYISILKKYAKNDMEVGGHVNHTDSKLKNTDPLFKLSEQRAAVIYEYLIDNGFDSTRVTHKGYGNERLLFVMPQNIEEKRKNMRVEVTIFKTF